MLDLACEGSWLQSFGGDKGFKHACGNTGMLLGMASAGGSSPPGECLLKIARASDES